MPESKDIKTVTTTLVSGGTIQIKTEYAGHDIYAFIAEEVDTLNGVSYIEGELMMVIGSVPMIPVFSINSNGELIVTSSDAVRYHLDTMTGQLQYVT